MDLTLGGGDVCGLHGFPCDGLHGEEAEPNRNLATPEGQMLAHVQQAVEFLDDWDIDAEWVDVACLVLEQWLEQQKRGSIDPPKEEER